jgi:hypothetical protein
VAMGLSSGELLEEFEIDHRPEGFQEFFSRIEKHLKQKNCPVAVAMEGYNGYARPLDSLVRQRGYRLYNLNNLKFARFKEIFPGAAKSDGSMRAENNESYSYPRQSRKVNARVMSTRLDGTAGVLLPCLTAILAGHNVVE